nr:hypothetical protein WG70_09390 [Burkholderia oklahomensis EO147]
MQRGICSSEQLLSRCRILSGKAFEQTQRRRGLEPGAQYAVPGVKCDHAGPLCVGVCLDGGATHNRTIDAFERCSQRIGDASISQRTVQSFNVDPYRSGNAKWSADKRPQSFVFRGAELGQQQATSRRAVVDAFEVAPHTLAERA